LVTLALLAASLVLAVIIALVVAFVVAFVIAFAVVTPCLYNTICCLLSLAAYL